MILSFALTTEEFLSGKKTATRRFFAERTIKSWQKAWDEERLIHKAYDKVARVGGKQIGEFRLTCQPYLERLGDMPLADLEAEGGMVDTIEAFCELVGKSPDDECLVIRFEKEDG